MMDRKLNYEDEPILLLLILLVSSDYAWKKIKGCIKAKIKRHSSVIFLSQFSCLLKITTDCVLFRDNFCKAQKSQESGFVYQFFKKRPT